jgi:predicted DNA-binding protein
MLHSIMFPLELWNRINEFKEKEGRSFAGAVKRLVELGFLSLENK